MKRITVFGIMDTSTGLLWNQTHKKFGPLAQNTLFLKDKGQYNRLTCPTTCGYKKRILAKAVDKKMAINRARKWNFVNGKYQHKES